MVSHCLAVGSSVPSAQKCGLFQHAKSPLTVNYCSSKWRSGIVAAASPGPQQVTKPPLATPFPPLRPTPPPNPGQSFVSSNGSSANGNGNGNGISPLTNGAAQPNSLKFTPPGPQGTFQRPVGPPPPPPPAFSRPPPPSQAASTPVTQIAPPNGAQPQFRAPSAPPPGAPPPPPARQPTNRPPNSPSGGPPASSQRPAPEGSQPPSSRTPPAPSSPPTRSQPQASSSGPRPAPPPAQLASPPSLRQGSTPPAASPPPAPRGPPGTRSAGPPPPRSWTPPNTPTPRQVPVANPFTSPPRPSAPSQQQPASVSSTSSTPTSAGPPGPPPSMPALSRPGPRPTQPPPNSVPRPLGPPSQQQLQRPSLPNGPPSQPPSSLLRPPARPDTLLARQPPGTQPTTALGLPSSAELIRPDPPSLRVLEPLIGPEAARAAEAARLAAAVAAAGVTTPRSEGAAALEIQEVVEDEEGMFDDEDEEFMNKGVGGKAKRKKGSKRKEKVTAEMKREARRQREASRQEKASARRRDKEDIFEVGDEGMSLDELAVLLQVTESDIVRTLFMRGITMSMSQMLDKNTVKLVAAEYDVVVVDKDPVAVTDAAKKRTEYINDEDVDDLATRPPVVTVMGHVDHGKTSLLDYIRKARVAAGEAGGITQAIGAYNTEVEVEGESKTICFLDTPGHEAFSAMRARGAQVTDIAIIIVAADDGVRPQTREAVAHAQAAGVPIVVAINKVDKPGADVERVKQELLELNLVPEEWGGSTVMVPVSAKKGTGVAELLTQLLWVADERQLASNPKRPAAGTVIEAYLDKKRGPVATLLVQVGTLRPGDVIRAGASYGKVRALANDLGQTMVAAGPSIAVQLTGLNSVPAAGEEFEVYSSEQDAREAALQFEDKIKLRRMLEMSGGGSLVTLASLATVDEDQEALQRLNLIIKADTSGMVEAIKSALSMLPQQSVALRFLLAGAGEISASDIDLAAASGGLVLAFNQQPDEATLSHAKRAGVSVKSYRIIYELIEDVKAAMEGKLKLVEEKVTQGTAVVKAVFGSGKKKVAGVSVTEGKMSKAGYVTVRRGKTVVYEGKLSSLRRIKDAVEEVGAGLECGLGCDSFTEWAEGDVVECYLLTTKSRRLEDARATTAVDVSTLQ